ARRVDRLPGDDHRHHRRLAGAGRQFQREAKQFRVRFGVGVSYVLPELGRSGRPWQLCSIFVPYPEGQRRMSGSAEAVAPAAAPSRGAILRDAGGRRLEGRSQCVGPGRSRLSGHGGGRRWGQVRMARKTRKWLRKGLKTLIQRAEMVWPPKAQTGKI